MALKKELIDVKGVKTRYHKITSFEFKDGGLIVKVRGYVNQATRDAEKSAQENNQLFYAYNRETEALQGELDAKSATLAAIPDDESPERAELKDEVIALTEKYNARVVGSDRPEWQDPVDRYYSETEVRLPFIEPVSFESMYKSLVDEDAYSGAESI